MNLIKSNVIKVHLIIEHSLNDQEVSITGFCNISHLKSVFTRVFWFCKTHKKSSKPRSSTETVSK